MRYIYLLFILCLVKVTCAQDKGIVVIGPFKPGLTTVDDLMQLQKAEHMVQYKITNASGELRFVSLEQDGKMALGEVIPDTVNMEESPADASYCPGVKVFMLSKYEVNKVRLQDIYLKFYKDTLYLLEVRSNLKAVKKLMTAAYGQPAVSRKEYDSRCHVRISGRPDYLQNIETQTAWENDKISASIHNLLSYDELCRQAYTEAFTVTLVDLNNRVSAYDKNFKEKHAGAAGFNK